MYLGDSLQWNTRPFLAKQEVVIAVPEGPPLEFPSEVAADPGLFDAVIDQMLALSERNATASAFASWLAKQPAISGCDAARLTVTYESLDQLRRQGRNHIWGYVARSLVRPIWLATPKERADVVIGNPPGSLFGTCPQR